MDINSYDWRAAAAAKLSEITKQASQATDDKDVEQAFAAQSYQFVANRLGDLMKDEHKIGFETVRKNDENTRMLGIYGFKVEDTFLCAVVFFLNGEIKGPLLYRGNTSTFVPATKEWSAFLIESIETAEGVGRSRTRRYESAPRVNMQRIAFAPPGYSKRASAGAENNATPTECKCPCKLEKVAPKPKTELEKETEEANEKINLGVRVDVPDGEYSIDDKVTKRLNKTTDGFTEPGEIKMAAGPFPGTLEITVDEFGTYLVPDSFMQAVSGLKSGGELEFTVDDRVRCKVASEDVPKVKEAMENALSGSPDSWADQMRAVIDRPEEPIIREFLEIPVYGKYAAETIVNALQTSEKFAMAVAGHYPNPADLFPTHFTDAPAEKQASEDAGLMFCVGADGVKAAADETNKRLFEDGFVVLDERSDDGLSVIVEDTALHVSPPQGAGSYAVLMQDGSFKPVFVGRKFFGTLPHYPVEDNSCIGGYEDAYRGEIPTLYVVIDSDGRMSVIANVVGMSVTDGGPTWTKELKKGKWYAMKIGDVVYPPFLVDSVSEKNGITSVETLGWPDEVGRSSTWRYMDLRARRGTDNALQWKQNPDVKTNLSRRIIGHDAEFTEIKTNIREEERSPWRIDVTVEPLKDAVGNADGISSWLAGTYGVRTITMTRDLWKDTKEACYKFGEHGMESLGMDRAHAMVKLARDMMVPAGKAYELLDKVDKEGKLSLYLAPSEKCATVLRMVDRPIFQDEFDSEFGILSQPTQSFALPLIGEQIKETPSHIGDAYDPTVPGGLPPSVVVSVEPDKLRGLADTYGLPHVFQHATVAELADSYSALPVLEKSLGRLEDGVDVLGRQLFLLYWKPEGYEQAYGKDDMGQLEAELKDNFERLGSLYLKLLKKTDKFRVDGGPAKKEDPSDQ